MIIHFSEKTHHKKKWCLSVMAVIIEIKHCIQMVGGNVLTTAEALTSTSTTITQNYCNSINFQSTQLLHYMHVSATIE